MKEYSAWVKARKSRKKRKAETVNLFFLNQQSNLIPFSESDIVFPHLPSYTSVVNGEFIIPYVNSELLSSIPTQEATGDDGTSVKLLKITAPAMVSSLSRVINHCIDTQTFPVEWKIGKVTLVFKGITALETLRIIIEQYRCFAYCQKYLKRTFVNICKENSILLRLQSQDFGNSIQRKPLLCVWLTNF